MLPKNTKIETFGVGPANTYGVNTQVDTVVTTVSGKYQFSEHSAPDWVAVHHDTGRGKWTKYARRNENLLSFHKAW